MAMRSRRQIEGELKALRADLLEAAGGRPAGRGGGPEGGGERRLP